MSNTSIRFALISAVSLAVTACGGIPTNTSLESIHQPVVSRENFTIDLNAGPGGLSPAEQGRLTGWLEAMNLGYADRLSVDDPLNAVDTRLAIQKVAGRYGVLLSQNAPVTPGALNPGTVRVIMTRYTAGVPGCPDWSAKSDANPLNGTSPGYGCAVNGNLAGMIANPEHLLKGASTGTQTQVTRGTKAIDTYRDAGQTGGGGATVRAASTGGN